MHKKIIIAGGGLVTNELGELLLIYRRGKWDLPKGKLDLGETIEACAIREVMEETGVKGLGIGTLIEISQHEYFDRFLGEEVIKETHWFAMKASSSQTLIPQLAEDITEIRWLSGASLEACLADSYPNVVATIKKFNAF